MYRLATMNSITDRQTHDIIIPVANHCVKYDQLNILCGTEMNQQLGELLLLTETLLISTTADKY